MQNRFVKNIIFLLFLNLLVKPFWILGIDREVQNLVGNAGDGGYGVYLAISNFSYLFYILLDMGITNFNNRNIAQNHQLLTKHFAGISQVKLFLGLVYAIVIFSIGLALGYRGYQLKLLAWCGLNQILLSFILYLRSNISGLLIFKVDSFLSVFDRILAIIICSVLLWSGLFPRESFTTLHFVQAQTVAYVCTFLVALAVVLRHTGKLTFKINMPFFIMILKQSLPFALLVLLMSFYSRLEPVLLERLLDDKGYQSGIYAQAYRLFDAGNNISNLFAVLLLPMFASLIKEKGDLNGLVRLSFNAIVAMAGIIAIMGILYSDEVMRLLYVQGPAETAAQYASRTAQASMVFRLLMGSFFALSTTYVFGTLLTANGSLKQLNIIAASGVAINLLLNLVFIPMFKSTGAAVTSLCVQGLTAFAQFLICEKIFKLQLGIRYWLHLALFIGSCILCTWLLKTWIPNMFLSFGIGFCLNVGLIFITRLLRLREIISFILPAEKR